MPSKSYDELELSTQSAIDSLIFITEMHRIINGTDHHDERDIFVGHPKDLVNYLRGLYALDCQTSDARYANWGNAGALVRMAKSYQQQFAGATDGTSNMHDLVDSLTNLPYNEPGENHDRQR